MTNALRLKAIAFTRQVLILLVQLLLRKKKGFQAFAKAMRMRESSGNYRAVNPYGYLGAYQFGMPRLSDLGLTKKKEGKWVWKQGYSQESFLSDKDLQDRIFEKHTYDLYKKCEERFSSYLTDKLTLSGLVAGAHLGGLGGVSKYFQGTDASDANGTKVGDYIREFSGYEL